MVFFERLSLGLGKKLPIILQVEAAECGLACLAMIASYYGYHTDLAMMRSRFPVSLKGTDLRRIMHIAHSLQLGTRALRIDCAKIPQVRKPCILHWNFNHFVVLKEMNRKYAVIYDPASGIQKVSHEKFSQCYTGVALELWPTQSFETRRPSARIRLRALIGPMTGLARSLSQIVILALVLEIFALIQPLFLQWVIDEVIVSADRDLLTVLVISFGLLLVMQQTISAVRSWAMMYFSTSISVQWRANVFSHLLSLPIKYFERRHLGDVISRFGAVEIIQKTLTTSFLSAVVDGLVTVITLAMMFLYSWKLSFVALITMTLYGLLRAIWFQPLQRATEEEIIQGARQQSFFLETVRGLKTIKLFNRQSDRREGWLSLFIGQINAGLHMQKMQLLYQQLNGILFGIEGLVIIWLGASMVIDNVFTVGGLIAFNAYKMHFDGRVSGLIDKYFEVRMLRLQGERLADIVLAEPEQHEDVPYLLRENDQVAADIRFENISFKYAEGEPMVLDGVTLDIQAGESVAIVGASGCGKTTLVHILLGVLTPEQGRICIGGIELGQLGHEQARNLMGSVLQDDVLFAGSIADNICFFDTTPDLERITECARMAAVHEDITAMPMGYNTLVGDMGTVLSGGQKQRVLLARALYKQPIILVLDEATSHLDIQREQEVNAAVDQLQMTRLIVAHRPETIASASRVVTLAQGKVISDSDNQLVAEVMCN
ncbi:Toxin RTX-I translocation ATP-binding protein [Vibrio ruber DSM 16370]|uniref:Toxin RTX-I translocation ATP-binding protein n=1 Tax=Vibrio ruber (strain DSM 16370 / JCM 11486 / BCRC 17186 / CECT 7878 / LMG 23124 / VR1) TaxID=1123498 RepID=A0A1R4LS33_VIBR1|nr:peptidase domain-containing ABC transporter [Vibrio ruber]SJN59104.1 Toxin RTX-I translocation ATP-binding protein [Vibrio ruber DSM 16370]